MATRYMLAVFHPSLEIATLQAKTLSEMLIGSSLNPIGTSFMLEKVDIAALEVAIQLAGG